MNKPEERNKNKHILHKCELHGFHNSRQILYFLGSRDSYLNVKSGGEALAQGLHNRLLIILYRLY